jgi:hypothetical protein
MKYFVSNFGEGLYRVYSHKKYYPATREQTYWEGDDYREGIKMVIEANGKEREYKKIKQDTKIGDCLQEKNY